MKIQKARALLHKFRVPENIILHSETVMRFAETIAKEFVNNGEQVNIDDIKAAALLHDILKIVDIRDEKYKMICEKATDRDIKIWNDLRKKYKGMDHAIAGYKLLKEMDEDKLARMVLIHRFDAVTDKKLLPLSLEEKIITYADKRVLHDKIVSLKTRFMDGKIRYDIDESEITEKIYEKYFEIEKELQKRI